MRRFAILALFAITFNLAGCGSPEVSKPKPKPEPHDHDHEHEHAHHGPNGGHFAFFAEHKYHVEWTHDEKTGDVNLYILDDKGAKEVAAESAELVVVTKEGSDSKEYTLAAVEPKDGKTSHYKTSDKDFHNTIEVLSDAITAEIKSIKVNGEEFTNIKLVEDPEHHHD